MLKYTTKKEVLFFQELPFLFQKLSLFTTKSKDKGDPFRYL